MELKKNENVININADYLAELCRQADNDVEKLTDILIDEYKVNRTPQIYDMINHVESKLKYLTRIKFKSIALYILSIMNTTGVN